MKTVREWLLPDGLFFTMVSTGLVFFATWALLARFAHMPMWPAFSIGLLANYLLARQIASAKGFKP